VVTGKMDFTGAMGTYFYESFFHAPHLMSDQHNSQQKFPAALQWYRYIFDPTAADDELLDEQQRKEAARDRVWRFIEFRGLDVPSLRKILTDAAAIDAYQQDPCNPYAIARLRLNAFQKCIVMRYADVHLSWADMLFTEFQMETVNEATLHYVHVAETFGLRPAEVGDCGEGNENERTYEAIARTLGKDSQFLVEMETYTHVGTGAARSRPNSKPRHQYVIDSEVANYYRKEALTGYRRRASAATHGARSTEDHETSKAQASGPETEIRHAAKAEAEHGAAHPFHWKAITVQRTTHRAGKRRRAGAKAGLQNVGRTRIEICGVGGPAYRPRILHSTGHQLAFLLGSN
jgi:hypothetical protein